MKSKIYIVRRPSATPSRRLGPEPKPGHPLIPITRLKLAPSFIGIPIGIDRTPPLSVSAL